MEDLTFRTQGVRSGRAAAFLLSTGVVVPALVFVLLEVGGESISDRMAGVGAVLIFLGVLVAVLWMVRRFAGFEAEYALTDAGVTATTRARSGDAARVREVAWADVREYVLESDPLSGGRYLEVRTRVGPKLKILSGRTPDEFAAFAEAFHRRLDALDAATPGVPDRIPEGRSWLDGPVAKAMATVFFVALVSLAYYAYFLDPEAAGWDTHLRLLWISILIGPFIYRVLFSRRAGEQDGTPPG